MTPPGHAIAAALGRLVSLLRYDAPDDAQQAALWRLRGLTRLDGVRLSSVDGTLIVDDQPLDAPSVADLAEQMDGHGVSSLDIHAAADPTELMAVARALAAEPDTREPGAAFRVRFPPHNGRSVRVKVPEPSFAAGRFDTSRGAAPDAAVQVDAGSDSYLAFAAVEQPTESLEALFVRVDESRNLAVLLKVLDSLTAFGEQALRDGRPGALAEMLAGVIQREAWEPADDRRRALGGVTRRFRTAPVLSKLAGCIVRGAGDRKHAVTVLAAADTLGADAIIEALVNATERTHRQAYLQALREVPVASGSLSHMLGDARWFVTRNAAYLIGELQLTALDGALYAQRGHADERVRLAVLTALGKLGTSKAIAALQAAVRDASPAVRRLAASAVGALPPERTVAISRQALATETDDDVRAAFFGALAQSNTDDAVTLLAEAAAPGGRLFGRKPSKPRVAAVQALQRMSVPRAQDALDALKRDHDAEVRAAANAPPPPQRRTGAMTPLAMPVVTPDAPPPPRA